MAVGAAVAVGGSIIGGLINREGQREVAGSTRSIAEAERVQAGQMRAEDIELARESRELALKYAATSPEELAQVRRGIALNEADIARKQKLIDSADPALIEAGKQALELLQGKEAALLDPIRQQRAKQRSALESKLRQQLGSGFETSSIGQEALREFDTATTQTLAQEQQRSLGQLLGVAQTTSAQGNVLPNVQAAQTLGSVFSDANRRSLHAITSIPLSSGTVPANTGAQLESIINARANAQFGQDILGGITTAALFSQLGKSEPLTFGSPQQLPAANLESDRFFNVRNTA